MSQKAIRLIVIGSIKMDKSCTIHTNTNVNYLTKQWFEPMRSNLVETVTELADIEQYFHCNSIQNL